MANQQAAEARPANTSTVGGAGTTNKPDNKPDKEPKLETFHNTSVNAKVALARVQEAWSRDSGNERPTEIKTKTYRVSVLSGPSTREPALVDNCLSEVDAKNTYCVRHKIKPTNYRLEAKLVSG